MHAADRLMAAIAQRRAPVCVGLDPVLEKLPSAIRRASSGHPARAIADFSCSIIDAIAPSVPCVKFQSACYERYGSAGVAALEQSIAKARESGLQVILDAKRGDIGLSAEHYAAAAFDHLHVDWLTVNGYLGADSLSGFVRPGKGLFVLVRTSNPGGDDLQERTLADGSSLAEAMGDLVRQLGHNHMGESRFSAVGAVVGATRPETAQRLRSRLREQIFLVPGYGAQGGGVDEILPCFNDDGHGAIVTASRSIIFAFQPDDANWSRSVADAAASMAEQIGRATGWRR